MSNDEFTKLFRYMTERFDRIDRTLEAKAEDADMQRVLGLLDSWLSARKYPMMNGW